MYDGKRSAVVTRLIKDNEVRSRGNVGRFERAMGGDENGLVGIGCRSRQSEVHKLHCCFWEPTIVAETEF